MFQVLVKTTAVMNGSYTYLFGSAEERDEFVKRPDVWWYHLPEEDDDWRWHRGGAWRPAHELSQADIDRDLATKPLPPRGLHPNLVIYDEVANFKDSEDDDDRW